MQNNLSGKSNFRKVFDALAKKLIICTMRRQHFS